MTQQLPIVITFTGASSSGKTYLSQLLENENFQVLVSDTTRMIRAEEVDGVHYNFLTPEKFQENLDNKKMLQFNPVNQFMYGLSYDGLKKAFDNNKNGLVVVAPLGVPQISSFCEKNHIKHLAVYIDNPKNVLMERIVNRLTSDLLKDYPVINNNSSTLIELKNQLISFFNNRTYKEISSKPEDIDNAINSYFESLIVQNSTSSGGQNLTNNASQLLDDSKFKKIKSTYVERILAMSSKEFETWVLPAYTGQDKYHLIVTQFDSNNQQEVIDAIKRKIEEITQNTTQEFYTEILDFSNHYKDYLIESNKKLTQYIKPIVKKLKP